MNRTMVYLITLLCAVVAKAEKGFEACLSTGYSLSAYRVLAQLSLPESSCMRINELARALVIQPSAIETALCALEATGDLRADAANLSSYRITHQGCHREHEMSLRFGSFLKNTTRPLAPSDHELLHALLRKILIKPGSFFSHRATSLVEGKPLPIPYCISATCLLSQAIGSATKYTGGLSLTDFRFLLELVPKRRGVVKQLRAKEVVRYLRVSRSYVSIAAARLEKQELIKRIPDERDARGVLFELSPQGELVVGSITDDIQALLSGMLGQPGTDLSLFRILRALLRGVDDALIILRERT